MTTQSDRHLLISSTKKDEELEGYIKSKREELEKMIPGFVDDRNFTDIVLNFYERGIRDGVQMMKDRKKGHLNMKVKCVDDRHSVIFNVGDVCDCVKINAGVNMYRVSNKKGRTLCSLEELKKGDRFKIIKTED